MTGWPEGPEPVRCEATTTRGLQCVRESRHLVATDPGTDPPELFLCGQHFLIHMREKGFKVS